MGEKKKKKKPGFEEYKLPKMKGEEKKRKEKPEEPDSESRESLEKEKMKKIKKELEKASLAPEPETKPTESKEPEEPEATEKPQEPVRRKEEKAVEEKMEETNTETIPPITESELSQMLGEKTPKTKELEAKPKKSIEPAKEGKAVKGERIAIGITGFDELVQGGIPRGSLVLLKGPFGAGKSTFAMDFLVKGIEKGEPGCYISMGKALSEIVAEMNGFNWNLNQAIQEKKLAVKKPELHEFGELLSEIERIVKEINAKRLVFDSLSFLKAYFQSKFKLQKSTLGLEKAIKKTGCTSLLLSESAFGNKRVSGGMEGLLVDGIIELRLVEKENVFHRGISVIKMRSTDHSLKVHPFQIEDGKGIIVNFEEKLPSRF